MTGFDRLLRCRFAVLLFAIPGLAQRPSTLETTVELHPDSASDLVKLAVSLLKTGQPGQAAGYLDRALRILGEAPEAAYPHYLRAKVYTDTNDVPKAEGELSKAVTLEPEFAAAWSDLGQARKSLLNAAGAFAAFKRAVELDPEDSIARYRLGAAYLDRAEPRLAIPQFEKALSVAPDDQSSLYSLQRALREDGQTERADAVKRRLAETLRRHDIAAQNALKAVVVNNEGAALQKNGDLPAAREKYRAALELYPENVPIRVNLAIALLRTGQWSEGLSQLREAMRRDPLNDLLKRAWNDAASQAPPGTTVDGARLR